MEQIPIRVLNQDTAGVLAKVEQGAVIEVTNRGHPIARIVPAKGDPLAGLVEAGVVLPPTVVGPFSDADGSSRAGSRRRRADERPA